MIFFLGCVFWKIIRIEVSPPIYCDGRKEKLPVLGICCCEPCGNIWTEIVIDQWKVADIVNN